MFNLSEHSSTKQLVTTGRSGYSHPVNIAVASCACANSVSALCTRLSHLGGSHERLLPSSPSEMIMFRCIYFNIRIYE